MSKGGEKARVFSRRPMGINTKESSKMTYFMDKARMPSPQEVCTKEALEKDAGMAKAVIGSQTASIIRETSKRIVFMARDNWCIRMGKFTRASSEMTCDMGKVGLIQI